MEGLRVIGDPNIFAMQYYDGGIDELLYIDLVASLYGRSSLSEIVSTTIQDVFVPITVAGGIRSVEDVRTLLMAGADKVAINTAAVERPDLLNEVAKEFGSQCLVLSVEAKKLGDTFEVYTNCGRESTKKLVSDWISEAIDRGVGEILLTSIDRDGTMKGLDPNLLDSVTYDANVPIIASGGFSGSNCLRLCEEHNVDGLAIGATMHFNKMSVNEIKSIANKTGLPIRL